MAEITLLYNLPLLVTVNTEDKTVTSVVEDYDNIQLAWDGFDGESICAWRAVGDDKFAEQVLGAATTDPDVDTAIDVAESESWPVRDS